ncbi:MAG: hypothetical protein KAV00_11580 [Phycisphaerae bacterium]|nr:hypothetical protein [Phycisphaerae bacterium]
MSAIKKLIAATVVIALLLFIAWYAREINYREPARLQVEGMTRAIAVYIATNDGQFPSSFEQLANSGLVTTDDDIIWEAKPMSIPNWHGPTVAYPFCPDKFVVNWGYKIYKPSPGKGEALVRHVRLSEEDVVVVKCNRSIVALMEELQREKPKSKPLPVVVPTENSIRGRK